MLYSRTVSPLVKASYAQILFHWIGIDKYLVIWVCSLLVLPCWYFSMLQCWNSMQDPPLCHSPEVRLSLIFCTADSAYVVPFIVGLDVDETSWSILL